MIYFLEDTKLATDLRDDRVTEFDKFIYFMILAIWSIISSSSSYIAWSFHPPTPVERILDFYIFVVSVASIWTCYERNKEGDNRDFITRMTCLGFPAFVRMSLLGLLIYIPGRLLNDRFDIGLTDQVLTVAVNLIIWPYMYWRIYKSLSITAFPQSPIDKKA